MQLYAITEGRLRAGSFQAADRQHLLTLVRNWTAGGIRFIQLREKSLGPAQLASVAQEVRAIVDPAQSKLLINVSSPELSAMALATGADGVHLAGKPTPGAADAVRQAFRKAGRHAMVSLPCHTLDEVALAREEHASLILFSPVFEKASAAPQQLEGLRQACMLAEGIPVFALGGVTVANAAACLVAGAAGVAGIRLFAEGAWQKLPAS